jgi:hypothetical protein
LKPQILLTFDLEEFDLPLESGCPVPSDEQISVTKEGLERLTILLSKYNIPATFFTTSFFARNNKALIRSLTVGHEIASHSKSHSAFSVTDLPDSKSELEEITGKKVYGFRMPRFREIDKSIIKAAGYRYDSSVNPTFIPGRYNNLFTPRKIYIDSKSNLVEIPVSVSPVIRFPLFWLSFKNIPLPVYIHLCRSAIWKDSNLHLYFHPWEFAELKSFNIPWYIKIHSGNSMALRFEKLIVELGKMGDFSTISGFLNTKSLLLGGL